MYAGGSGAANSGIYGRQPVIASAVSTPTTYTFNTTHVWGQLQTNDGSSSTIQYNLPVVYANYKIRFFVAEAQAMTINPDNSDKILDLTDAVGDAIQCSTVGGYVELTGISETEWAVTGIIKTWADVD
jgi:hypothetical protein